MAEAPEHPTPNNGNDPVRNQDFQVILKELYNNNQLDQQINIAQAVAQDEGENNRFEKQSFDMLVQMKPKIMDSHAYEASPQSTNWSKEKYLEYANRCHFYKRMPLAHTINYLKYILLAYMGADVELDQLHTSMCVALAHAHLGSSPLLPERLCTVPQAPVIELPIGRLDYIPFDLKDTNPTEHDVFEVKSPAGALINLTFDQADKWQNSLMKILDVGIVVPQPN